MGWVKEKDILKTLLDEKIFLDDDLKLLREKAGQKPRTDSSCLYCHQTLKNRRPNVKFCTKIHRSNFYTIGSPKKHRKDQDFGGLLGNFRSKIQESFKRVIDIQEVQDPDYLIKFSDPWNFESELETLELLCAKEVLRESARKIFYPSRDDVYIFTWFKIVSLKTRMFKVEESIKKEIAKRIREDQKIDIKLKKEQKTQQFLVERTSPNIQNIQIDPEVLRIRETLRKTIFTA